MKKKLLIIISLVIILILIIYLCTFKTYSYNDHTIPSTTYKIRLNKITKTVNGTFIHTSSAVEGKDTVYKYSVKLTNDEYKKIMKIWKDKDSLSPILETICENDKIFYNSIEDSYEDNKDEYNKMDANSDGKVTSREYADNWLNITAG